MGTRIIRDNRAAIPWIRAAFIAITVWGALRAMSFYPDWLTGLAALAAFALAMWAPAVALLLGVACLAIPLAATDFVVGAAFCLAGFVIVQALSSREAAAATALLVAVVSLPLGAGFAGPVLAGYLFGLRDGSKGAALGAVSGIIAGALLGAPTIGVLLAGGRDAVIALQRIPADPLRFAWLSDSIAHADLGRVARALGAAGPTWALAAQPLLWVGAAAAASSLRGLDRSTSERARASLGLLALTALLAGISAAIWRAAMPDAPYPKLGSQISLSLAVVALTSLASEWVFPRKAAASVMPPGRSSLRTEEADVDELLRLIASAEEELASRHTRNAVVMLTDLKAFSQMTEQLGSIETAKIVQRHRDVLLPIIERHQGKGKPTGGDGLVAAFDSPSEAVSAAVEMQHALGSLAASSQLPEDLAMRIGIASGEVVVDAGGRPFLGAALNLAARVMGLADGGRIFVSGDVARSVHDDHVPLHSHGEFRLKNIAKPVEVVEVLWKAGVAPQEISFVREGQTASGPETGPDA